MALEDVEQVIGDPYSYPKEYGRLFLDPLRAGEPEAFARFQTLLNALYNLPIQALDKANLDEAITELDTVATELDGELDMKLRLLGGSLSTLVHFLRLLSKSWEATPIVFEEIFASSIVDRAAEIAAGDTGDYSKVPEAERSDRPYREAATRLMDACFDIGGLHSGDEADVQMMEDLFYGAVRALPSLVQEDLSSERAGLLSHVLNNPPIATLVYIDADEGGNQFQSRLKAMANGTQPLSAFLRELYDRRMNAEEPRETADDLADADAIFRGEGVPPEMAAFRARLGAQLDAELAAAPVSEQESAEWAVGTQIADSILDEQPPRGDGYRLWLPGEQGGTTGLEE